MDLLVENEQKERLIIELQYSKEFDFFQRMLFATSKHLTETLQKGKPSQEIKKIFSINLIYFDLGHGTDYVYHGKTEFRGIHQNDILDLSEKQKELFHFDGLSEQEQLAYERHEKMFLSERGIIATARIEGKAEGRAEGLIEGEQQARLAMAIKMKANGFATETIAEMTGLSVDIVSKL